MMLLIQALYIVSRLSSVATRKQSRSSCRMGESARGHIHDHRDQYANANSLWHRDRRQSAMPTLNFGLPENCRITYHSHRLNGIVQALC